MAGCEGEALVPLHEVGIYTETLARLYLKQGFVEQALAIYRRLVQEQPEKQQLHERLHALEQLALGAPGPVPPVLAPAPPAAEDTAPRAPHDQTRRVLAQLERWLYYLQQQGQHRALT